ncbi:hypothetical protein ACIBFB_17760 [Nocardiopsis sp. NPDC050513]|uniref:hypothetical protein n=1 Tax=Nocardiopsis sp. NPDC050513 TaxID=3364338 RepID=UPI00378C1B3D
MPEIPAPPGRPFTVDDAARSVIARIAPNETAFYPRVRDEYFARGRAGRTEDNPLGFGDVVIGVVTGIVLTVLHDLAVESLTDTVRPWWRRAWRWAAGLPRFGRRPGIEPGTALRALTPGEAPAVLASVHEHALSAGLPPEQAERLAQAIVAELLSRDRPDGGDGAGTPS